jgi:hypothetical protein
VLSVVFGLGWTSCPTTALGEESGTAAMKIETMLRLWLLAIKSG